MDETTVTRRTTVTSDTSDKELLRGVIEHKKNGVMFHTKMMETSYMADMPGMSKLHEYHSMEEHYQYLCLLDKFIEMYGEMPIVESHDPDISLIEASEPLCEKMENSLEVYEDYENNTLKTLKEVKKELTVPNKSVEWLCKDTKEELEFIDKIQSKVVECKNGKKHAHVIDDWLCEHFKKKLSAFKHKGTTVYFSGSVSM